MDWTLLPVLLALGAIVGFLAGLLGIGGGMTLVPLLTILFTAERFPADHVVHMAVATSTATMVFTALSSVRAHHGKGACYGRSSVRWRPASSLDRSSVRKSRARCRRARSPPCSARSHGSRPPRCADRGAAENRRGLPARARCSARRRHRRDLEPARRRRRLPLDPFMQRHGVSMHNAVATSAALGLPIAVAARRGSSSPDCASPICLRGRRVTCTCRRWRRSLSPACWWRRSARPSRIGGPR